MLVNYLKIAWRTILRHKGYAAINLLGLALGMTCCLFILLWVRDEKSIDNFHADGDHPRCDRQPGQQPAQGINYFFTSPTSIYPAIVNPAFSRVPFDATFSILQRAAGTLPAR
jgi:hypothetical protein